VASDVSTPVKKSAQEGHAANRDTLCRLFLRLLSVRRRNWHVYDDQEACTRPTFRRWSRWLNLLTWAFTGAELVVLCFTSATRDTSVLGLRYCHDSSSMGIPSRTARLRQSSI